MKLQVKQLKTNAILPQYQTTGSAAADIHACLDEPVVLQPMERRMIPAGFALAIPGGYEVQIRARSGLSINHGIAMVNGVGTIDSDYRGELGMLVINFGQEAFAIEPGMRIAQMVLSKCERITWQLVDSLDETDRGNGGYGSTGSREA